LYIRFHGTRHPSRLGQAEVVQFLSTLAVRDRVSASTQNQAMAAISFLYREVLRAPLEELEPIARAKRPVRIPVVLTKEEVGRAIAQMEGVPQLVAMLLYGSGLRVLECLTLRVKDIDFGYHEILVRGAKGDKDRLTMLPLGVEPVLRDHLLVVRALHERDLRRGGGRVDTPNALARKYPGAATEWRWQYVFPAARTYIDPESREASDGERLRHPHSSGVIRPLGHSDDDDLHARPARRRPWRAESDRCICAVKEASECYIARFAAYRRTGL
jgi:integrase